MQITVHSSTQTVHSSPQGDAPRQRWFQRLVRPPFREVAAALVEMGAPVDIFEASALGLVDRITALVAAAPGLASAYAQDGFYGRKQARQGRSQFMGSVSSELLLLLVGLVNRLHS